MSEQTNPTTVDELAAMIDPAAAQKSVAYILAILGEAEDWGGDQLESIATALGGINPTDHSWTDQSEEELEFWESLW